jgi:hypothetical protein
MNLLKELRKTTETFIEYSLSLGRNLNPGPPEFEARVLIVIQLVKKLFAFMEPGGTPLFS